MSAGDTVPEFSRFRQIRVYESTSRFYLVGTDGEGLRFSVLKVDRDSSTELLVFEDSSDYSAGEIDELLNLISISYHNSKDAPPSLVLRTKAVALLGYYMLLATKAVEVAELGFHKLLKIEETALIYVPRTELTAKANAEEQRYLRTFQIVDLKENFYFSYSYDVTHSLQENILATYQSKTAFCYEKRYVWNAHLMKPLIRNGISPRWYLPIIHGCVSARTLSHCGCTITILLIARRSNRFAGTRFLKRGSDFYGNVANEVETEQIVFDTNISDFKLGRYTSFTQHRGSVPLVWSQDQTKMVAKPQIGLDLHDPYATVAGRHFGELRRKYGTPLVVVNLVKRREKRLHESLLGVAFKESLGYLNLFLPEDQAIVYVSLDMARHNKVGNVLEKLANIANHVVKLNGWFQSFKSYYTHSVWLAHDDASENGPYRLQKGVTRTNCVDCLDRTNTAQFVIGKVVLGFQMLALGMVKDPFIDVNCEPVLALEDMYQAQGDTLAMQYAGSQLVHSVRTYKKSAVFQERSRDVIQTLSRYYSSTFSDADKQHAMNLFLGVYRPDAAKTPIWELTSDYNLHNYNSPRMVPDSNAYCEWFQQFCVVDPDGFRLNVKKFVTNEADAWSGKDAFAQYYRPWELTSFDYLLAYRQKFIKPVASFNAPMPDSGGFSLSKLWGRTVDVDTVGDDKVMDSSSIDLSSLRPIMSETSDSGESSESEWSEDWSYVQDDSTLPDAAAQDGGVVRLESLFPSSKEVYGFQFKEPSAEDMELYTRYAVMSMKPIAPTGAKYVRVSETDIFGALKPLQDYSLDPSWQPTVPPESLAIYKKTIECSLFGPQEPSPEDREIYRRYIETL